MSTFTFHPSKWVPFTDEAAIERCRRITREQIDKHPNPDFKIRVVPDADVEFIWATDMFSRIKAAADAQRPLVMILPNPCPTYRHVARLINALRVDCTRLHLFAMDEYADQDGRIAPPSWEYGFTYAMRHYFRDRIDPALRPPESRVVGFTNENIGHYSKLIADAGGADICYSGPGWTGHLAFIEPDAPEFDAPLEEWKQMGARLVTLSPFTLAQNSLHGSFGMSGDLAAVPPRAATIRPADVIAVGSYLAGIVPLLGLALVDLGVIGRGRDHHARMGLHAALVGLFLIVGHVAMIFGMLDPTVLGAAAGGHSGH